jgi:hypothetical protein
MDTKKPAMANGSIEEVSDTFKKQPNKLWAGLKYE